MILNDLTRFFILCLLAIGVCFSCENRKEELKYYRNGQISSRITYIEGSGDFQEELFYPNGERESVSSYRDSVLNGEQIKYYTDGTMMSKVVFKNGKRNGPFVIYNKKGRVHFKGSYRDDLRVGWYVKYYTGAVDERIEKEVYLVNYKGEEISIHYREYDVEGRLAKDNGPVIKMTSEGVTPEGQQVVVSYTDDEYDSLHLVMGKISYTFELQDSSLCDTVTIYKGVDARFVVPNQFIEDSMFRAYLMTYRFYDGQGDTLIRDTMFNFFEQKLR